MRSTSPLLLAVLTGLAISCAHASAPPAAPAPAAVKAAPAPDPATVLPGHWTFTAQLGDQQYSGTLDFSRDAEGWHARLAETALGETPVNSVVLTGQDVTLQITAGGEPVTVTGTLQPDGTLLGKVLAGEQGEGTFAAKKS